MLQQHLLLGLLLREDHIEAFAVEVIPHAVRITIHYLCLDLLLFVLLLVLALSGLALDLHLRQLPEVFDRIVGEAADNEVLSLVVVVAQHFLQFLPLFEVPKRDVL